MMRYCLEDVAFKEKVNSLIPLVPATPTRALIRIGDVWPGGKCASKDLCYSPCPGGVLTFCLH